MVSLEELTTNDKWSCPVCTGNELFKDMSEQNNAIGGRGKNEDVLEQNLMKKNRENREIKR